MLLYLIELKEAVYTRDDSHLNKWSNRIAENVERVNRVEREKAQKLTNMGLHIFHRHPDIWTKRTLDIVKAIIYLNLYQVQSTKR